MRSTEGTSVIVTGGGSGLGAATAAHMARLGARVTICGRRPEKVKSVAESIGPNCAWVRADVDDPDDRACIIDAALEHGGGIDVLVNNAGNRYVAPLARIEEEQVADTYRTNVVSPIMLSQLALPHLAERKGPSSLSARWTCGGRCRLRLCSPLRRPRCTGSPECSLPSSARKACGSTAWPWAPWRPRSTRAGLASGVEETRKLVEEVFGPITPLRRSGSAEEVAEAIEYLAYSEWTTGAILDVDGGLGLGTLDLQQR